MASQNSEVMDDGGTANCCVTKITYKKCYIQWNIEDFSLCRQSTGEYLSSCIFSTDQPGDIKFRVDLYPRGTVQRNDYIVVSIRLLTGEDDVRTHVNYKCFLYKDKRVHYEREGECPMGTGDCNHQILLIERNDLYRRQDELLQNDVFSLVCMLRWTYGEKTGKVECPLKSQL